MNGLSWSSVVRGLAWIIAISFFISSVLTALLAFNVLGPPPERGEDFIRFILDLFRWEQDRWPIDFAQSALGAIGFFALGALVSALRRLTVPDGEIGPEGRDAGGLALVESRYRGNESRGCRNIVP